MNDFHQIEDFFSSPRRPKNTQERSPGFISKVRALLPSKDQLNYLPHVLSARERVLIILLTITATIGFFLVPLRIYQNYTNINPGYGGSYTEGLIGNPAHINPVLAIVNDVDRDISKLIYPSLMKYNGNGDIDYDLAGSYSVSNDGLSYTFKIRDSAQWQDGKPITSDDVIFTIYAIQNQQYGSPLRLFFQGVQVSKKDSKTVVFSLKNKYAQFINTLTVGILPKHIWENVPPAEFATSEINIKPIGGGPYKFNKIKREQNGTIKSYELTASETYYGGEPYISTLIFKLYPSEDELLKAYNSGAIEGMSSISSNKVSLLRFAGKLNIKQIKLPRYFSIFYNQGKNPALSDPNVRKALELAIDRQKIIKEVLLGYAKPVTGPLLPGILSQQESAGDYNPDQAKSILDQAGWIIKDNDQFRKKVSTSKNKEDSQLEIEITTSNWEELVTVIQKVKEQWEAIGIKVTVRSLSLAEVQQSIKNRDYQALFYGEHLDVDPDPFRYWHSSEKRDPGLNLALFDNKKADQILEEARQTLDPNARSSRYADFSDLVEQERPALFIYSDLYLYPQPLKIKGNETTLIEDRANRFDSITSWYINTSRSAKK